MPAVVRWRLLGPNVASNGWRDAVDFRRTISGRLSLGAHYARWTRQNHASVRGRYRVYVAHDLDTDVAPGRPLPDRGRRRRHPRQRARASAAFSVGNHGSDRRERAALARC